MSHAPIFRTFHYRFGNDSPKTKTVDLRKHGTILDFKKLVSIDYQIPLKQLVVFGQPNDVPLSQFKDNHTFILVVSSKKIINFRFHDKVVSIEDCDKMSFGQVIERFNYEGFFYSPSCIQNNLHLTACKKELAKSGYPFAKLESGTDVSVGMRGSYLNIKYCGNLFVLSDNEKALEAYRLLNAPFGKVGQISIFSEEGGERIEMETSYHLKCGGKYTVKVMNFFVFKGNDGKSYLLQIDYASTVLDAKRKLVEDVLNVESGKCGAVDPKQIRLFNSERKHIHRDSTRLCDVQPVDQPFYFLVVGRGGPEKPESGGAIPARQYKPNSASAGKPDDSGHDHKEPQKPEEETDAKEEEAKAKIKKPPRSTPAVAGSKPKPADAPVRFASQGAPGSKAADESKKTEDANPPSKPSARPKKMFKPKVTPVKESSGEIKKAGGKFYTFKYGEEEKKVEIAGSLKDRDNVERIKEEFGIDSSEDIEFYTVGKDAGDGSDGGKIIIRLRPKEEESKAKIEKPPRSTSAEAGNRLKPVGSPVLFASQGAPGSKAADEKNVTNSNTSSKPKYSFASLRESASYHDDDELFESLSQSQEKDYKTQIMNLKQEYEKQIASLKQKYETKIKILEKEKEAQALEVKKLQEENAKLQDTSISHRSNQLQNKDFTILDNDYIQNLEKIEEIGFGGGGKVFKVMIKQIYAIKEMKTQDSNTKKFQQFIQEYQIMNLLDHPNILKAFGIFLSNETTPPFILLELCPMNLQKKIEHEILSNLDTAKIIYQIAEGMKYIHFRKIIHRDLKPTNILIASDGTIKICDFGISKLMTVEEQLSMTGGVGSQNFMAPEIINEEEKYDEKVDVYSFGVLVFFILSGGQLPKIKIGDILNRKKAEIPKSFTNFAKNLINECWNFDSKDRPSFKTIVEMLASNHYNLIKLTDDEKQNIEEFVKKHQQKIPPYEKTKVKIAGSLKHRDNTEHIQEFGIDASEDIEFCTVGKDSGDGCEGGKTILYNFKTKPSTFDYDRRDLRKKAKANTKAESQIKYKYQINREQEKGEVSLGEEATVRDMKVVIAKENDVSDVDNVKILFAGKDLLDDIVLSDLEIGDSNLFVYIRNEDIFLMTAKALRYTQQSSEYYYEYEYEEENDEKSH